MFKTKQEALEYLREHDISFWDIVYIAESTDGCKLVHRK